MRDGEEVARVLADFVNSTVADERAFVDAVMREHRTLQQSLFRLFLATIQAWAQEKSFDDRNARTVELSRKIVAALGDETGVPLV